MKYLKLLIIGALSFSPVVANAQAQLSRIDNANQLIVRLASFATVAVYLMISLAIIYIVWNIVQYFIHSGKEEGRTAAGMNIFYGIVGLAIILSLWGLVAILTNTFSTNRNTPTNQFPNANFVNGNSSTYSPNSLNSSNGYSNYNSNPGTVQTTNSFNINGCIGFGC